MTKQNANKILYSMWENGEIPSNFTEEHSHYNLAVNQLVNNGFINWDEVT